MQKIIARVDDENGCPLYKVGDGMEFNSPSVMGTNFAPVCMRAVFSLAQTLLKIQHGEAINDFKHVYCGGCSDGQAWFTFKIDNLLTVRRLAPDFAKFALEAISHMKLFSGIRPQLLERILPLLRERRCNPAEVVVARGDASRAMSVIVLGKFEVVSTTDTDDEQVLATLEVGDCFGEMSLITGEPASATVRCKEAGCLLEITRDDFPRLVGQVPALGLTLARILAARLTRTSSWVVDQVRKGIIGRLEMIPPAELIQAMNVSGQTGTLIVMSDGRTFSLYFENGQPMDASLGILSGEQAAYKFLSWHKGPFRFEPGRKDVHRTIHLDSVGLLLEGLRQRDEQNFADSQKLEQQKSEALPDFLKDDPEPKPEPMPQPAAGDTGAELGKTETGKRTMPPEPEPKPEAPAKSDTRIVSQPPDLPDFLKDIPD